MNHVETKITEIGGVAFAISVGSEQRFGSNDKHENNLVHDNYEGAIYAMIFSFV